MKKILIIACWIGACLNGLAQSLIVKNVEELANDISARTLSRVDKDNNPCALVRINLPTLDRLQFEGAVVGDVKQLPGEYIVYLEAGTASLSYTCNGKKTGINFADYDIAVEGKKSYRITLEEEGRKHDAQSTRAYISANYDNVIVMIDGIPMGQLPVSIESIEEGRHTIAVPNTSGITMKDTVVVIAKGKENKIYLSLHEEEPKPVPIDLCGDGIDGNEPQPFWGFLKIEKNGKKGLTDYNGEIIVPCEFDDCGYPYNNGICEIYQKYDSLYRSIGLYKLGKGIIFPCIYEGLANFNQDEDGMFMLESRTNHRWGLFDVEGNMILPFKYKRDGINWENGIIRVIEEIEEDDKKVKYGKVYDYNGKLIYSRKGADFYKSNEGYSLFSDRYKGAGLLDVSSGKIIDLPNGYSLISHYVSSGLFLVRDKSSGKYGYMDTNMRLVIPAIFDNNSIDGKSNFQDGIAVVQMAGKHVVINKTGQILLGGKFINDTFVRQDDIDDIDIYRAKDGKVLFKVRNNQRKYGIYDASGKIVIPCLYEDIDIQQFANGDIRYMINGGIYDSSGQAIVPCQQNRSISIYEEDGVMYYLCHIGDWNAKETCHWEIWDKDCNLLFALPDGINITREQDGFIQVMNKGSLLGYINIHGEILANCIYGSENNEGDGYEGIEMWNQIGDEEHWTLEYNLYSLMYDNDCISEGLAIVNLGNRFGYMDNTGKFVVPMIYTAITPFVNGVAYARGQEGKWKKIYRKDL